jgi:DNA-directed RNA polymerases I, II, and III subunit RPABC2
MADDDFEDAASDAGVEDQVDDTEFDFGTIELPGIKPELKRLYAQHPELIVDYIESVLNKVPLKVVQPTDTKPDENHKTYPFVTLYERTKIIGLRANQLSQGARPFIVVPPEVTDVKEIARLEFAQKRLPYIIKRPLPNGTYEFWRLQDLMQL